ncbi:DUF45 domain-containing protein [Candidatus Saccharibacteria bacterium]|nr:DUF45 domain-containing protein [Candidatus Saccharibacteria bacterium]
MAIKYVDLPEIGAVTLQKRRGNRSLRISIAATGVVKVSLPPWAPYRLAIEFAKAKRAWILKHRREPQLLSEGQRIGKAHRLVFVHKPSLRSVRTQLKDNLVIVALPQDLSPISPTAQRLIHQHQLLPSRLHDLAAVHGFTYQAVSIKRLLSRWGSCDQRGNITLNCYLMQLPWHLIDYVLLHELIHTRVMAHGDRFWSELERFVPNLSSIRKEMRASKPMLNF